jgi:uncharacterized protein
VIVLLDVNVIIALIDPDHIAHERAHEWFERRALGGWATCPIVENGAIRIVGSSGYDNVPGGCGAAAESVQSLCDDPRHCFWPDDLSLIRSPHVDVGRLLSPGQVTDTYLLALAVANGGRLATLDRRLSVAAVSGGAAALEVID